MPSSAENKEAVRQPDSCVVIRRMEKRDLPGVADLEKQIFADPWSRDGFEKALAMESNIYLCAVLAKHGEEILGYCGMYASPGEGEIVNVAVRPDCRRRGIACRLLTALLETGRQSGVERFILEVRAGNVGAIRLYEQLGFEPLGVRKGFYEHPREDAVIMAYGERVNE